MLVVYKNKRSYWKVCRRGAFQYLSFSTALITTDPGLRLSRMTTTETTQSVDSENPAGRQFRMAPIFITALFFIVAVSFGCAITKRVLPNKSNERGKSAACKARPAVCRHPVAFLYGIWRLLLLSFPSVVVGNPFLPWLVSFETTDPRQKPSGMTAKQCNFCRCFFAVYFKGVVSFFFFVKILTLRNGYTRMYPPYKNVYKRPFWPFKRG